MLRAQALAPDPDTLIIVNRAGRTRSIIGTQSLVNTGSPNRVAALRNYTIGWTLAAKALDRRQQRPARRSAMRCSMRRGSAPGGQLVQLTA